MTRSLVTLVAIVSVALLVPLGLRSYRNWALTLSADVAMDCYAVDVVAEAIVRHVEKTGALPQEWDDLADDVEMLNNEAERALTFKELQDRVVIDFARIGNAEEHLIVTLVSGRRVHWEGREPNEVVRLGLRGLPAKSSQQGGK